MDCGVDAVDCCTVVLVVATEEPPVAAPVVTEGVSGDPARTKFPLG